MPAEVLKNLTPNYKTLLLQLFNRIYEDRKLLEDFKTQTFIPISKKKRTSKTYAVYQIVALLSHAMKILLLIINASIQQKMGKIILLKDASEMQQLCLKLWFSARSIWVVM